MKDAATASKAVGDETARSGQKATAATEQLTRSARKNGEAWKRTGALIGGLVVADKLADFARASIQAAADAQQSIGSVDAVFKQNSRVVQQWAKSASRDVGLSANTYRELATLIGSQLKNAGTSLDQLGAKTNDVIKIGADLSAMYGGTAADAVAALSSALKGEMDPIEKYGISLNQAALQQEALNLGLVKGKEQMSQAAKAQAILSLVTRQGADASGAFASEADTLAHKQQVLAARVDDLKESLGDKLLPIMDAGLTTVSGIADAFGAMPKPLQYTTIGVTALGTAALVGVPKVVAFRAAVSSLGTTAAATTTELEGTAAATALASRAGAGGGLAAIGAGALRAAGPVGLLLGSLTMVTALADEQSRTQHADAVAGLVGDPKKLEDARRKYEDLVAARDATARQSANIAVGSTKQAYAAAYAYQGQAGAAKELDAQVRDAEAALREQAIASGDAGLAAQAGASLQDQLAAATAGQKQATEAATAAVKSYRDGLNALLAPYLALPQANAAFEESLDALSVKTMRLRSAFKEGTTEIDLNTAAGRRLQSLLIDQITAAQGVADATFNQTGSVEKANKAWNDSRDRIITNLQAMGLSKKQAEKLASQFGLLKDAVNGVPGTKDVKTTATGAKTATDQVRDLRDQIALLQGKTIAIRVGVGKFANKKIPLADGGFVSGPGGPREDAIPAMLSDGEFVVNAASTARHRPLLEHLNGQKFAAGGYVQHFAKGGKATVRTKTDPLAGLRSQYGRYLDTDVVGALIGQPEAVISEAVQRINTAFDKVTQITEKLAKSHKASAQRLTRDAGVAEKALSKLADKRDAVVDRLKDATDQLKTVQDQYDSYASGVSSTAGAKGALSDLFFGKDSDGNEFMNSWQNVAAALAKTTDDTKSFTDQIDALSKAGLSQSLIEQIVGSDHGASIAQAILAGGQDAVTQLNANADALAKASTDLGKRAADSLYGAGVSAAQGLVDGLASQQKAIEAQMVRIAEGMQKAIKKALGIHSPSTVMHRMFRDQVGGAAVLGLSDAVDGVRVAASRLAVAAVPSMRPVQMVGSMAGQPVNVYVTSTNPLTGQEITEHMTGVVDANNQTILQLAGGGR